MLSNSDRSSAIQLRDVLPHARFVSTADIRFSSCETEASLCRPGCLYVALTTPEHDGHEEAAEALRRGATAVLAERLLPVAAPQAIVRDSRAAYARLAHALAGRPSRRMQVFTVAGGAGKTAVAVLLESILSAAGTAVAWRNSLASFDGEEIRDLPVEATDVADLVDWLHRSAANGCERAVVEVSVEQLATQSLAGLEADVAVLHGGLRADVAEERSAANARRLCNRLTRQLKEHSAVVANVDQSDVFDLLKVLERPSLTAGVRTPADVSATIVERTNADQTFLLQAGPETVAVRTTLLGDHQVSNCVSAAAAAILAGIDLSTIATGLERVVWLPGQLERVECGQPFGVYVDAGSDARTVELALRSVRKVTRGRVIVVCGAKSSLPTDERARLGRVLETNSHLAVLTSDDPGEESPLETIHDLLDGFDKPERAWVRPGRGGAIDWALQQARAGDSVVLCGKALDGVQLLADGAEPWDDGEQVRQRLYRQASPAPARPTLRVVSELDD